MFNLKDYLDRTREWVEAEMDRRLPRADEWPEGLHAAMRYSLLGGGKRLRPILCAAAAEAVGGQREDATLPAVALECLHTYTLIHDDLPAMDNDDLRRGQPTSHKAFGEANAILAGDCLLTVAFELLAQSARPGPLALELARAAGSRGVAGGQYEDIASERATPNAERVRRIHLHKTARLIEASCRLGAIAARGDDFVEQLGRYGRSAGLAFQIVDDILNATSTPEQLGKAAGSDTRRGKLTWVAVHGLDRAQRDAWALVEEAVAELHGLPGPVEPLAAIARYIVERHH